MQNWTQNLNENICRKVSKNLQKCVMCSLVKYFWKYKFLTINILIRKETTINQLKIITPFNEPNTKQPIWVQKWVSSDCFIGTGDITCQNTQHTLFYIHYNENCVTNRLLHQMILFFFTHSQLCYNQTTRMSGFWHMQLTAVTWKLQVLYTNEYWLICRWNEAPVSC
jgi:hypothetical protein